MNRTVIDYQSTDTPKAKRSIGRIETAFHIIAGLCVYALFLPSAAAGFGELGARSQSTPFATSLLLLEWRNSWTLYLFAIFGLVSMVVMLISPLRAADSIPLRFGLISGGLTMLLFTLLTTFSMLMVLAFMPLLGTTSFFRLNYQCSRLCSRRRDLGQFLRDNIRTTVSWAVSYLAAWAIAVKLSQDAWVSLPLTDGGCYVVTASSRGHGWLVKRCRYARSGKTSLQLQRYKIAEGALQQMAPQLHTNLRRAYDRIGPPIAQQIDSPWLADAAYISLKPFEWIFVAANVLLLRFAISTKPT